MTGVLQRRSLAAGSPIVLFLLGTPVAQGQTTTPTQRYEIDAKLDTDTHVVSGTETLRFANRGPQAIHELYLHAFLNAFRNERTRFMRDGLRAGRSRSSLGHPGELVIQSVRARELGQLDLYASRDLHSPGDPDDATDLRLPLPAPLPSGATLTLDIAFEARLPELVERAGFAGRFHAVTQWFPKLARQVDDGTFRHFAYATQAEFAADFADYRVTIDVPSHYVVAAPGQHQRLEAPTGRARHVYELSNAHDFAWFTWDDFVARSTRIDGVTVTHFAASHQRKNAERTLQTLCWALPQLSRGFTSYPYRNLVVVHPPDDARAASAMEYPGLIVAGGPWFLGYSSTRFIESVTVHELVHQWFYGLIANDEYLHPVLDEGLTAFVTTELLEKRFGNGTAYSNAWFELSEAPFRRRLSRQHTRRGPLAQPAVAFSSFDELAGRVYARFSTLLETLSRVHGLELLAKALRNYAERFRFRHPEPLDLVSVIKTELGDEAATALSTSLFADGWVDYAIGTVHTQAMSIPSAKANRRETNHDPALFRNELLVERRGTLSFPVTLEVVLQDGQVLRQTLERLPARQALIWTTPSPILRATIDPDERITIDDNVTNQTWQAAAPPTPWRLHALLHALESLWLSVVWP